MANTPENDEIAARLAAISGAMNSLTKSADATVQYDMLSGALWWSDERAASGIVDDIEILRHLLHY